MKCCNISRQQAIKFDTPIDYSKTAWISIMEPDGENFIRSHIKSDMLDKCSDVLKVKFWDVEYPCYIIGTDEQCLPISDEMAKEILAFLLKNKDKNIVVNCAAGVSRSSAICRFCQDFLGHEWTYNKSIASPNIYLYKKLIEYYMRQESNKNE